MHPRPATVLLLLLVVLARVRCFFKHYSRCETVARKASTGGWGAQASAGAPPPPPPLRREKKNKYGSFSKVVTGGRSAAEGIERTLERIKSEELAQEQKLQRTLPTKGTTVPVFSSVQSDLKARSRNGSSGGSAKPPGLSAGTGGRPQPSKVVPGDPASFGYSALGTVLGPHGIKGEVKVVLDTDFADYYLGASSIIFIKKPNRMTPRPIKVVKSRRFGSISTGVRETATIPEPEEIFDESREREIERIGGYITGEAASEQSASDVDTGANTTTSGSGSSSSSSSVYLVQFESVESRFTASAIKGYGLFVKLSDRPALRPDEFMIRYAYKQLSPPVLRRAAILRDLVGMRVYDVADVSRSRPIGAVRGVVPPSELCQPSVAHLMHSMLEVRLSAEGQLCGSDVDDDDERPPLCLLPFVPQICVRVDTENRAIMADIPTGLLELTYSERRRVVIRGFLPESCMSLNEAQRRRLYASKIFTTTSKV